MGYKKCNQSINQSINQSSEPLFVRLEDGTVQFNRFVNSSDLLTLAAEFGGVIKSSSKYDQDQMLIHIGDVSVKGGHLHRDAYVTCNPDGTNVSLIDGVVLESLGYQLPQAAARDIDE